MKNWILLFLCLGGTLMAAGPLFQEKTLFTENTDGFRLYRIPGIVCTATGAVLVYCEARKYSESDYGEIEIQMRRSTDGGHSFSRATKVAHFGPHLPRTTHQPDKHKDAEFGSTDQQTVNNAVAIAARNGLVHFIYCVEYLHSFYLRSEDDGLTWSKPVEITPALESFRAEMDWQAIAAGPGHAIEMKSGRLVVPFWMSSYAKNAPLRGAAVVIYSDNAGRTWQRGEIALPLGNEADIAELPDGRVLLTARNSDPRNRRLASYSPNGATGWSKPEFFDDLLEPGCMGGILAHPGSPSVPAPVLLYSNPRVTGRDHKDRRDLTVHLSRDDGKTWPVRKLLHAGPSAYSDLAALPDGTVLCVYESGADAPTPGRKRPFAYSHLKLAIFNLDWVSAP